MNTPFPSLLSILEPSGYLIVSVRVVPLTLSVLVKSSPLVMRTSASTTPPNGLIVRSVNVSVVTSDVGFLPSWSKVTTSTIVCGPSVVLGLIKS